MVGIPALQRRCSQLDKNSSCHQIHSQPQQGARASPSFLKQIPLSMLWMYLLLRIPFHLLVSIPTSPVQFLLHISISNMLKSFSIFPCFPLEPNLSHLSLVDLLNNIPVVTDNAPNLSTSQFMAGNSSRNKCFCFLSFSYSLTSFFSCIHFSNTPLASQSRVILPIPNHCSTSKSSL